MIKTYSVHDHWTDINKKNDVDIESIDGVITGIKVNGEDYGGSTSWSEVFSGDVVTSGEAAPFSGTINAVLSGADTIKVVYNDGEYILPIQVTDDGIFYGATPGATPGDIDFSQIPFLIKVDEVNTALYTQAPGPQNITILEPASGGGESDFSTAEVTFISVSNVYKASATIVDSDSLKQKTYEVGPENPVTVTVPLYKGKNILPISCIRENDESYMPTTEGSIEFSIESLGYIVTGDGSITAKGGNIG